MMIKPVLTLWVTYGEEDFDLAYRLLSGGPCHLLGGDNPRSLMTTSPSEVETIEISSPEVAVGTGGARASGGGCCSFRHS